MGHGERNVSVAAWLESRGRWQERTPRGMQELHHVGGSGALTRGQQGRNERVLSQGGKMFSFVFYKEHYRFRVQNGSERRADAGKPVRKLLR